jgi:hypothetical protein
MDAVSEFERRLPPNLRADFRGLKSPANIQDYLDGLPYIAEERDRSALGVMTDRQSHCLDGGFFAALALRRIGFRPLVVDLVPAPGRDDDHVLAVFQMDGLWGAVAKSNFTGLGFREPVYRGLRELVMSYFEDYYNFQKERTLRGYTRPLDLTRFDASGWMWDETGVKVLARKLYSLKSVPLLSPQAAARLTLADERAFQAACLGTDFGWVYGLRPDQPH